MDLLGFLFIQLNNWMRIEISQTLVKMALIVLQSASNLAIGCGLKQWLKPVVPMAK
jgi:hypothetical protein